MLTRHLVLQAPAYELHELLSAINVDDAVWELTAELSASPQLHEHGKVGGYTVRLERSGQQQLFELHGGAIYDDSWFRDPGAFPSDYRGEPNGVSFGYLATAGSVDCTPNVFSRLLRYIERGYLGPVFLRRVRADGFAQELFYAEPACLRSSFATERGYRAVPFTVMLQVDPFYGGRQEQADALELAANSIEADVLAAR